MGKNLDLGHFLMQCERSHILQISLEAAAFLVFVSACFLYSEKQEIEQ